MKKTIVTAWLFLTLIPSLGIAEEPIVPSVVETSTVETETTLFGSNFTAVKVQDEELLEVVGHGLVFLSPWLLEFPLKQENVSSRIKLWDEAARWGSKEYRSPYSELFQKTALSVVVNK